MESTKENRVWHDGAPPHVGWWNVCSHSENDNWRFFNGKYWSMVVSDNFTVKNIGDCLNDDFSMNYWRVGETDIKWCDYYPDNARVPRIDPNAKQKPKKKTQQVRIIERLKKGWCNSLEAVADCGCIKLTTRVNEPKFQLAIYAIGLKLERKEIEGTRYVSYRLVKK